MYVRVYFKLSVGRQGHPLANRIKRRLKDVAKKGILLVPKPSNKVSSCHARNILLDRVQPVSPFVHMGKIWSLLCDIFTRFEEFNHCTQHIMWANRAEDNAQQTIILQVSPAVPILPPHHIVNIWLNGLQKPILVSIKVRAFFSHCCRQNAELWCVPNTHAPQLVPPPLYNIQCEWRCGIVSVLLAAREGRVQISINVYKTMMYGMLR